MLYCTVLYCTNTLIHLYTHTAHNRWIIHVTNGHPGARNDKTIVKTDEFVQALKCGDVLGDVKFVLYRLDGTEYELEGAYLITDNGMSYC